MSDWKSIWNRKQADESKIKSDNTRTVFMELKRLTGNDTLKDDGVRYESFEKQFFSLYRELSFPLDGKPEPRSFFEVGCGSGAFLYLIQQNEGKAIVGGMDYSESLIGVASMVIKEPRELYCDEACNLKSDIKYNIVFSYSAFEYFPNIHYATEVLDRMLDKAEFGIGIFDIHDESKREAYIEKRRSIIEGYDVRYAGLNKLFYEKEFFIKYADMHNLDIKITACRLDGYWNADYTYDVYLFKRV